LSSSFSEKLQIKKRIPKALFRYAFFGLVRTRFSEQAAESCFQGKQLRESRQNRFAVCLGAVRRWLRFPNDFSIFLRYLFAGIFFAFKTANSNAQILLRFQYHSL